MKRILLLFIVFSTFLSCASLVNSGTQEYSVTTEPSGATVKVFDSGGVPVLTEETPAVLELKRGGGYFKSGTYTIEISKTGFETVSYTLESTMDAGPYLAGNIIYPVWGWFIIDPLSGAMWQLDHDEMYLYLKENPSSDVTLLENGMGYVMIDG